MDYVKYLKTYQEIAYKVFFNALKNDKIFHAYLLTGEHGTPLLEIAKFLSASIILKGSEPFEIIDENAYRRILENKYGDFVLLDAKKDTIKIDQIRQLEEKFSSTAEEKYGIKVYIINAIENLQIDSLNALLKFLEEPSQNTYAFIITENEFSLLPTIKSRVQTIHFTNVDQTYLINEAIKKGANEGISEILSFFYNNEDLIYSESNNPDTKKIIELVLSTFDFSKSKNNLMDFIYNTLLKSINTKILARTYFDYLIIFFKEALNFKHNQDTVLKKYDNILKELIDLNNLDKAILCLMNSRNEINYNLNLNLLIVHTLKTIFGE